MSQKQKIQHALRSLKKHRKERRASEFLGELDRLLNLCTARGFWRQGEEAAEEAVAAWNEGLFAMDDIFVLLHHIARFHSLAGQHATVVELYVTAASRFADFNAFQSAYRLLADAEEYAIEHKLPESLLHAREGGASIALFEGDLAYAEKTFSLIRDQRIQLGLDLPVQLLTNLGTLQMKKGSFSSGVATFRKVIDSDAKAEVKVVALANCSACLRELDKIDEANACLEDARALVDGDTDDSVLIELDLIEGKTATRTGDSSATLHCLNNVVARVDSTLHDLGRLHYRRGLREQYRQRVAAMLCAAPKQGATKTILAVIAFLKSNSLADWMALLDWHDWAVQDKQISSVLRDRLTAGIRNVVQRGAPILYGYREKYDDPWSFPWNVSDHDLTSKPDAFLIPWHELNNVIREICAATSNPGPWANAASFNRAQQIQDILDQGDSAIVVFVTAQAVSIFVLDNESYERFDLSNQGIVDLNEALWRYQAGADGRQGFMERLQQNVGQLADTLAPSFDEIASAGVKRIVIFPEALLVPVFASLISHEGLRDRAKKGDLAVSVCPVLHRRISAELDTSVMTACSFEGDRLRLDEPELDLISQILTPTTVRRFRISVREDIRSLIDSPVVHIAAHGEPISNLRDAFFSSAHPAGKALPLTELQEVCWKTSHRLVFLNSCFSGDVMNWNAFVHFQTNEQIGLPGVLLLNRRSMVIASSWTTFDVAAYIFSYIFYYNLHTGSSPEFAFTKSCAELYELRSDRVREMLNTVADQEIRAAKQRLFMADGYPFRHSYVSGTYQLISLL